MGTIVCEGEFDISKLKTKKNDLDTITSFCYKQTILRPGIDNLLEKYSQIMPIIILSDTSKNQIKKMMNGTGKYITSICSGKKFVHEELYEDETYGKINREIKDLCKVWIKHGLKREDCIYLGDSCVDLDSATKYGVDFIFIPSVEVAPNFSFEQLIHPLLKKENFTNKQLIEFNYK